MKIAALVLSALAVAALSVPASAESSYWEQRWRSRDATPEYRHQSRRHEDRRVVQRRHVRDDRRAPKRRYVERRARIGDVVPNPFRVERHDGRAWPTMNNDYWQQSSNYDFTAGKAADLKQYRY